MVAQRATREPAGFDPYHPAMLLAVDIGNTNVTTGLFRNGVLVATRRATTRPRSSADEVEHLLDALLRPRRRDVRRRLARSSPAPSSRALTDALATIAERRERPLLVASVGHRPDRDPDRPAGRGRRRPAGQRARRGPAPRHAGDRRRLRHRDDVRLRGRRRRVRRRGDRARARARARGARRPDREAAAGRAASAGPGDRPRHRRRDPVRHDPRPPGAGERPARPDPRSSSPRRPASIRREVRVVLTGGLSAAPWAQGIDDVDAIDPDLTLKGLAILHAEVGGGQPLELGLPGMTGEPTSRLDASTAA